jgi:hypothetical protein
VLDGGRIVRLADGLIEAVAAILFASVSLSVARSLVRSGNVSALALAFLGVFAVSAPHRAFHAWRLLTGIGFTDLTSTAVDASVLVCLLAYALIRTRAHPVSGFTLIADAVGLERMRATIDDLTSQAVDAQKAVTQVRSDLQIERARTEVMVSQLRAVLPATCDLARHAGEIGSGAPPDRARLRRDSEALSAPLDEFSRTLGLS